MNTNTTGNAASRMMIARVSIGTWSARKLDRVATNKTTTDAGAVSDAARVNKYLLAGQDELLVAIKKHETRTRDELKLFTLPWNDNGDRILTIDHWQKVNRIMQDAALNFAPLVDSFMDFYATVYERARFSLGSLYDEKDFPPPHKVRAKFYFDFSIDPLPTAQDFRVSMTDDDADMIRKDIETRANDRFALAMRDLYNRLIDPIRHIAETLPRYEAGEVKKFNDSIIGNVREILAILPGLNITNDATLNAIAARAQAELAGIHPQTLRDDPTARNRATASAQAICATMAQHLGLAPAAPVATPAAPATPTPAAPAQVFDLFTAPVRAA